MARKRDIFDFFRNSQHRLNEAPPAHAWRRLERRLDAYRNRNRVSHYRALGMAAGILVLVILAGLVALSLGRRQAVPSALEDLAATDAGRDGLRSVLAVQQAQEHLQYPISEGAPGQKLILANHSPSSRNRGATLEAFQWMVGRWSSRENGQAAFEEWALLSDSEMAGTASLENDGQAREHMRLYTQNNKIYFSTDFGGKETVHYALAALNVREALFENLEAGFPQQLRLRHEGQGQMAAIYQNAESQLPDTERIRGLRKRHAILSMQAVRRMSRVNLQ